MRRSGWILMVVLATGVAVYALMVLLIPGFGPPLVAEHRVGRPWAIRAHLAGSAVALAVGCWQLNARLRVRRTTWHHWMGRLYVAGVVTGAVGALFLAPWSMHGIVSHVGFGVLAVLWLATTLLAYRSIRAADLPTHRRWMLRSYALTLAAVTLRIYLPLSQIAGLPFGESYQAIAWLCWVPNLLVGEWLAVRDVSVVPLDVTG